MKVNVVCSGRKEVCGVELELLLFFSLRFAEVKFTWG